MSIEQASEAIILMGFWNLLTFIINNLMLLCFQHITLFMLHKVLKFSFVILISIIIS